MAAAPPLACACNQHVERLALRCRVQRAARCLGRAVRAQHPATSELITDHKRIAKRYLRSWFWIDLLATFPSDYIVKGVQVSSSA